MATLAYAAAGAALLAFLGVPLPLLLGPMAGLLAAAVIRLPMSDMGGFGTYMRTFLGVAIGSTVTPELLAGIPAIAVSLAFVVPFTALAGSLGFMLFRRIGFDRRTSFYSAMPGGLQDMLIFGEEAGGNVRAISIIHATRVLVIFVFVPLATTVIWGLDLDRPPGQSVVHLPRFEVALMCLAGLAGWRGAAKIGIPGPSLIGPIILTAAFSLAGLVNTRPPVEMLWAAQFFIGIGAGARYAGITAYETRNYVLAGAACSFLTGCFSILMIAAVTSILDADPLAAFLAFLPGGQAEMAMIAVIAGTDVAYVVTHHITRIFLVILFAQVFAGWLKRS